MASSTATLALGAVLIGGAVSIAGSPTSLLGLHVIGMAVFVALTHYAAAVVRRGSHDLHGNLNFVALLALCTALYCIWSFKEEKSLEHYQTTHSAFGGIAAMVAIGAVCAGVCASYRVRVCGTSVAKIHRAVGPYGALAFTAAICSAVLTTKLFAASWLAPFQFVVVAFLCALWVVGFGPSVFGSK
eukprot:gnl/Spiro4/13609_TR7252_c0_g1_i1.p2 gnl/Spiro4/13609_TR7252_c0_g1~~gnl/Spiro4/13609_TR7252_c0_g1_i1.p2  ORF type:complete len:197 (-),score=57.33 gnl/Spiro4/13609_TR7252_c0_g1_i1:44-601(-)